MKFYRQTFRGGTLGTLKGGIKKSVSGEQVLGILTLLIIVHLVLAALMWSNTIQFATSDAKYAAAITISVAGTFLVIYALYIATES
jgi:hypothetical protein